MGVMLYICGKYIILQGKIKYVNYSTSKIFLVRNLIYKVKGSYTTDLRERERQVFRYHPKTPLKYLHD